MPKSSATKTAWKAFTVPPRVAAALSAWRALDERDLRTFVAVVNDPAHTHQIMTAAYGAGSSIVIEARSR